MAAKIGIPPDMPFVRKYSMSAAVAPGNTAAKVMVIQGRLLMYLRTFRIIAKKFGYRVRFSQWLSCFLFEFAGNGLEVAHRGFAGIVWFAGLLVSIMFNIFFGYEGHEAKLSHVHKVA